MYLSVLHAGSSECGLKTFVYVAPYFLILLVGENNYLILISVQFYVLRLTYNNICNVIT